MNGLKGENHQCSVSLWHWHIAMCECSLSHFEKFLASIKQLLFDSFHIADVDCLYLQQSDCPLKGSHYATIKRAVEVRSLEWSFNLPFVWGVTHQKWKNGFSSVLQCLLACEQVFDEGDIINGSSLDLCS